MMKNILLAALASLFAVGCATSSDLEKLQSQITDLQDQVAALKRTASSKEEVQNVNTKIAEQTQTLLKSNATLVANVGTIEEKMNNAQGAVEQTNYRVERMAQQLTQAQHDMETLRAEVIRLSSAAAATPAPAPAPGTPPQPVPAPPMSEVTVSPTAGDAGEDPLQTYQAAYRDYQRAHYDLAISGFRDFIAKNPKSDLVDNAMYWVAESLYSQKKYRDAIAQFDSVVAKFPKSDKVPGALLKKGYAYIDLGERAQGIVQLQYVVHEHPRAQEAALARQKLKQLGVETK